MKKILLIIAPLLLCSLIATAQPERIGQAGASQLLINSWLKSAGVNAVNVGSVSGIESTGNNPGGLATTQSTELVFAHSRWLMGSDISINTFGFSQSLGGNGSVLGLSVMSFSLGEFVRTTTDQPNGTLGTFSPAYLNIGLSYAKKFTDRIYVGTTMRMFHQSTPDVAANGVAFDAGIQYRTGIKDRLKLGISLRNVGPTTKFAGDGLSGRVLFQNSNPYTTAVEIPTEKFELPSVLTMGASVDAFLGDKNTITFMGAYISNSFFYNQAGVAIEYKYSNIFMLRGGFLYEQGIFGEIGEDRFNAYTGPAAGATIQVPFKTGRIDDEGNPLYSKFSLDANYRVTNPFSGTFGLGARIDL